MRSDQSRVLQARLSIDHRLSTPERAASHAGRLGRNRASKRCLQCARNVGVLYLLTIRGSVGHFLLKVYLCAAQGQRRLREKPRAKN